MNDQSYYFSPEWQEGERMYTVSEVAERLRLHPQTIREWLRDGTLKGVRLGGTKAGWRISGDDINDFLERRRPDADR